MNIFIIGGTGFLGSHIVNKLILKSHNVIVLTRNLNKEMQFDKTKVKLIQGDIAELNFIQQLPKSIDVIVYVAMPFFKPGRISKSIFFQLKNKTELYFKNTIELAKTIKSTLILTSGASFNTKNNEIADETWPIARIGMAALGKPYDDLISRVKKERQINLIEMLPAQIYGNGGLFSIMINMAKSGKVIIFGNGKNILPRVHVDDCANAYILAIEKQPIGHRFIVCDDKPCTVKEFMTNLAKTFNAKRIIHIPNFILRIVTGMYIYKTITMNTMVSNKKIKEELGWVPKYPSYIEGLNTLQQ